MGKSELTKHTLNLNAGDYEKLRLLFPDLGAGYVIRKIVSNYIKQVEAERASPEVEVRI